NELDADRRKDKPGFVFGVDNHGSVCLVLFFCLLDNMPQSSSKNDPPYTIGCTLHRSSSPTSQSAAGIYPGEHHLTVLIDYANIFPRVQAAIWPGLHLSVCARNYPSISWEFFLYQ
ncbi:MAG: hypothetical protein QGF87_01710, partial [Woeseiaceae bacterium]|nr:hypothetical protein [Woeseiaceae bacterium]